MMKKKVLKVLNEQVNHELYSAYVYLSMSAHCASNNLGGFANWLKHQSEEEADHAMKIYNHILERGEKVTLLAIDQPPKEFKSPLQIFEDVLKHERKVTSLIHTCYETAVAENDYPAQIMLQWFIEEQVEEEQQAEEIVEQLKMAGESGTALLMMDKALGARATSG
jgi:ferritin